MASRTDLKGLLYVLVGPSGVGKNTMMKAAMEHFPHLKQLPTATTRPQRAGEQEGREHFFLTRAQFENLIERGELLEWQIVHEELYGIPRQIVEDALSSSTDLIADIEVLGAAVLRREYPDNTVLIFITPPDKAVLEERIRARGGVDEAEIARRLRRADFEMPFVSQCDYLIINDQIEQAAREMISIVYAAQGRHSLARLTVSVLIYDGHGQVLVRQENHASAGPIPPRTFPLPGEPPYQAALRMAEQTGVGPVSFCCQPNPAGEISPAHFHLLNREDHPGLDLVFACQPDSTSPATAAGWQWEALERVPLAQTVWNGLQQAALIDG